jgi:CBS domain-containing protein
MSDAAEVARFLAAHPPFAGLDADRLLGLAEHAGELRFTAGEDILVEDGPPATVLYVVAGGSVELVHEGEVIDILEPGEAFGHTSLLTGQAPAFSVRAHEDPTTCHTFDRDAAFAVLGSRAGVSYVAQSMRERLTRTGHTVHALPELGTVRIPELITREALFCEPSATIHDAAIAMTEHGGTAILVAVADRLCIVTDADLRARVVAGDIPREAPLWAIAREPVRVGPHRLAVDAVVDMLESGVDHLLVQDPGGEVLGIVSATDLIGFETWSPFALRHAALHARDEDDLVRVSEGLRRLFLALLGAGLPSIDIGRVLSLQLDSLRLRLIDFTIARNGPAPCAWAWLVLGSAARREFTLGSDQENGLAYADCDGDPAVDAYFERFAGDVNAGLERCGFLPDLNGVLARNERWRMHESAWIKVFRDCLLEPDNSHLIRATVSFDFRHGSGGLEIVPPLLAVIREAPNHPLFLRQLARTATDPRPPLRFGGSFALENGTIDIKRRGIIPVVNLARYHAISSGVTISATVDRLAAATESGSLAADAAAGLEEAFEIIARVRLHHHAAQIEAGGTVGAVDNLVDPDKLAPVERRELHEAFKTVQSAQKRLGAFVPQPR